MINTVRKCQRNITVKKIKIQFMKIVIDNVFFYFTLVSSLIVLALLYFFRMTFDVTLCLCFRHQVFFTVDIHCTGGSWGTIWTHRDIQLGFFLICCILVFLFTCMLAPHNYRDILNIYTLSPSPTNNILDIKNIMIVSKKW